MANSTCEIPSDDFLAQILGFPGYGSGAETNLAGNDVMMLQLGLGDDLDHLGGVCGAIGVGLDAVYGIGDGGSGFPSRSGLSLEQGKVGGFVSVDGVIRRGKRFHREDIADSHPCSSVNPDFQGQPIVDTVAAVPHPPTSRPRVRARRGQATDPHSIAERLRRERIAERIRALQELVPSVTKTDRATMLDEIADYVKFLRLQVKVLSMSRLGGASAVTPRVTRVPISSVEERGGNGKAHPAREKWSNDSIDEQVAKLMEENVGAAMQFLQSKALCIMPISLADTIYRTQSLDTATLMNPILAPHHSPSN